MKKTYEQFLGTELQLAHGANAFATVRDIFQDFVNRANQVVGAEYYAYEFEDIEQEHVCGYKFTTAEGLWKSVNEIAYASGSELLLDVYARVNDKNKVIASIRVAEALNGETYVEYAPQGVGYGMYFLVD